MGYTSIPLIIVAAILAVAFTTIWILVRKLADVKRAYYERAAQYSTLLQASPDDITLTDVRGKLVMVSPAALRLLRCREEDLVGKNMLTFIHPDDIEFAKGALQRIRDNTALLNNPIAYRLICKDGGIVYTEINGAAMRDTRGELTGFLFIVRDISRRIEAEALLQKSEQRYRLLAENVSDVIWKLNQEGHFTYISPSIEQLSGYTAQEAMVQPLEASFSPSSLDLFRAKMQAILSAPDSRHVELFEIEQSCKNKRSIWTEITAKRVQDETGLEAEIVGVSRNISERVRLRQELEKQATQDELTGLINRRAFIRLSSDEIIRARRLQHPLSIAIIDLDYFKTINDTCGHPTGDHVLSEFARLCRQNMREIDTIARLGGDEFAALLVEADTSQAMVIIERIRTAVADMQVACGEKTLRISLSAGIAGLDDQTPTFEAMLLCADQALYRAKQSGRNCVCKAD